MSPPFEFARNWKAWNWHSANARLRVETLFLFSTSPPAWLKKPTPLTSVKDRWWCYSHNFSSRRLENNITQRLTNHYQNFRGNRSLDRSSAIFATHLCDRDRNMRRNRGLEVCKSPTEIEMAYDARLNRTTYSGGKVHEEGNKIKLYDKGIQQSIWKIKTC